MGVGDIGRTAVAVSGAEFARDRRQALRGAGTTILLVDRSGTVQMAAGAPSLVGSPLGDVIAAPSSAVEKALSEAHEGIEASIPTFPGGPSSVRCLPLRAEPGKGSYAVVVISDEENADGGAELAELKVRTRDLETLAGATGALARSTEPQDVRRTARETALDVAGADVAAFLELEGEDVLRVVSSSDSALEGRRISLERATLAARALGAGEICFSSEVREDAASWPLGRAGAVAAAWQPVRRSDGIREVVAVGWSTSPPPELERLRSSLARLAEEAAVALDRAHALEQLSEMARTDPLTELSNRRAWQEELAREMAKAERGGLRLSIGLIDLDELKTYNDRWGHAAGDRVLLTAAARWRRRLRLTDLLARIGGDEFAVAMPNCGLSEAVVLGDQLRGALPDGVSCSIGVAEWRVGESPSELLARADEALYAAKNSGRDSTFSVTGSSGAGLRRSVPSN